MSVCKVAGCCETNRIVRGMCERHYTRWKRYGDPTVTKRRVNGETSLITPKEDENLALVELTRGKQAIIDLADIDLVAPYAWCYNAAGEGYAFVPKLGLFMHHLILGKPPEGLVTDHINRNGLDNRRANLRFANHSLNATNSSKINHIGGVRQRTSGNWETWIYVEGRQTYLGVFPSKELALAKRQEAEELHYGSVTERPITIFSPEDIGV